MTANYRLQRSFIVCLAMALFGVGSAAAQPFDLSWHTIDGGGATFTTGGTFELSGTIGQPDAGVMTGGTFTLVGGFWGGAVAGGPPCIGDTNGDGQVTLQDLSNLLSNFGTAAGATVADGDTDNDADVDLQDLSNLLSNFGTTC